MLEPFIGKVNRGGENKGVAPLQGKVSHKFIPCLLFTAKFLKRQQELVSGITSSFFLLLSGEEKKSTFVDEDETKVCTLLKCYFLFSCA